MGQVRNIADGLDIHGGHQGSRPLGATPYEAEHESDRASVGRGERFVVPEQLLTVVEVAARLKVCRATVYKMADRGDLPHVRIAGTVRVHPADLALVLTRLRR